ncbi:MAG: hypothetical protein WD771_06225 [Gemmatimonadaceae bacterium]
MSARMVVVAVAVSLAMALVPSGVRAQEPADTARRPVQDGIFNRPVVASLDRTAIGGYVEANTNYAREDGIGEGFSMELRRFNIFLFSAIGSRIRFISELEFEHGTEEIALETALLDFTVTPSLVLRAGIILPPVGAFNVNHDSPRWNFVDRPLVSTEIIPATLSEIGFGVHGRLAPPGFGLTYDLYATNGLGDGVILSPSGRTRLGDGKREEQFAEDNNGSPAYSGRLAAQHATLGEVGVSFYTALYNSFRAEGEEVDEARRVTLVALDGVTQAGPVELRGEMAYAAVDVPDDLRELFGHRQFGWHLDASLPVWRPRLRGLANAALHADLRLEYVDYNIGTFSSTGGNIGDEARAVVLGASFRPVSGTVFKANYRRQWTRDLLNNEPANLGAIQLGFATYF